MKVESSTKTVVTKCDITINLNGEREIQALRNICDWARHESFGMIALQEEETLAKILLDAITKP